MTPKRILLTILGKNRKIKKQSKQITKTVLFWIFGNTFSVLVNPSICREDN